MGRATLQGPGCLQPGPRAQRVPAEQGQEPRGGPQAIFPGTFLPLGGEASALKQANKKMTPKLSSQALQFGKSDGAGSPMYLKKQVPSGSAWKTLKVVQPGERGSYRDENYHIEGPGFLKVTAHRTGAIAVSAAVGCGPQAGPPAGEPQPGDLPSLPVPGRHQLRAWLCPSGRMVSRLLSLGPPLHRAHLEHPYSSPQGFPDLRLSQGGSPWQLPVPPCRAHVWRTLKEPTTHHGVTRVCTPDHASPGNQVSQEVKAGPEAEGA